MRISERTIISFLKRNQLILISVFLALFSLHLALTDRKEVERGLIVKQILSFVVSPLQRLMTDAKDSVIGVWSDYINLVWVNEENDALKAALLQIQQENNRLKEDVSLNSRLKTILEYKDSAPFSTSAAGIIGVNARGWTNTFIINKGRAEGIKKEFAVISPLGVVGRIIDVTEHTSVVLTNTDVRSDIDAIIQRTRVKGVAEGNGADGLILKYIRQIDDIQIGDPVITSGLSGVYPKGLTIGEVTRIEKGKDSFFKYVEVRPKIDLRSLEEVLVVTDFSND